MKCSYFSDTSKSGPALPGGWTRDFLYLTALILLIFLLYRGVGGFGPINLDDPVAIEDNPLVHHTPPGWGAVARALWYVGPLNLWHPVTWWSHQVDTVLFGFPAWGLRHGTNLAIHIAVAVTLYLFLVRLTGSRPGAFFGALLFVLHPQRVEAVAWLTARKELLAGLFVLLSAMAWLEWRRVGGGWLWAMAFGAFCFALGSHPVAVMFPLPLLFLDRICHQNVDHPAGRLFRQGVALLPFLCAAALVALGTLWIHRGGGLSGLESLHGPGDRLGRILLGAWHYGSGTVWPSDHRLFAIPSADQAALRWMALGGILVLAGFGVAVRKFIQCSQAVPLFGVAWLGAFFLPVSGLVAMTPYLGADRYTYLPHMGLAVIVAWFWPAGGWRRGVATGVALGIAMACFCLSERRLNDWKDSETLFRAEAAMNPRSKLAPLHLGVALLEAGRTEEALTWFERSLEIDPGFDLARHNAALARRRLGMPNWGAR